MYNTALMNNNQYKVGVYIRLSKEDEDRPREQESESVTNQRKLILDYLDKNGFCVVNEYVDDGISGTTFDRPAFNEMISDIESKHINMVITKDLSRLGRDYIKSGYYIEEYFPKNRIRYISILDGIDTFLDSTNNDIAPFKSLFNDMTSKDTSKKIKSILKNKKEHGQFLGSSSPFGYLKDPSDKHKLIIDPVASKIVKRIFDLSVQGYSSSDITILFNEEKVITPIMHKGKNITKRMTNPEIWTVSSIYNILRNKEYTGCVIQHVFTNLSYKNKMRVKRSSDQWVVVEGTHEPIIDESTFNLLATNRKHNQKIKKPRDKLLLEGLVFCKECGCLLGASYITRRDHWILKCNRYTRNHKLKLCTAHYTNYKNLEIVILDRVRMICDKMLKTDNFSTLLENADSNNPNNYESIKKELVIKTKQVTGKIDGLYDDKYNGIITTNTFQRLSGNLENELEVLNEKLKQLDIDYNKTELNNTSINFKKIANEIISIEKPSRNLLFALIEKIVISQEKTVEIVYRFEK